MRFSASLLVLLLSSGSAWSGQDTCRPNMVRVRVLDVKGNPVFLANVVALHTRIGDTTNESGWATLGGLPDEAITIKVMTPANYARVQVRPDSCGKTPVVVRLGPDHKVHWLSSDVYVLENPDSINDSVGNCEALVCASDSVTGRPIVGALVSARLSRRRDGMADLYFHTDSSGCVRIRRLPMGGYPLDVCSNVYGLCTIERFAWPGAVDTVRVAMRYLGPPADGRRCEVISELRREAGSKP